MREESRLRNAYAGIPQPREFPAAIKPTGNPQYDWARECHRAGRPVTILTPEQIAERSPEGEASDSQEVAASGSPDMTAAEWLGHLLANGPVAAVDGLAHAVAAGRSKKSIRKALKALKARVFQKNRAWHWASAAEGRAMANEVI
jgi:hypothetical protein